MAHGLAFEQGGLAADVSKAAFEPGLLVETRTWGADSGCGQRRFRRRAHSHAG